MDKQKAIDAFETATKLAEACGVTVSAVCQWSDPLPRHAEDKVIAALVRAGRMPPADLMPAPKRQRKPSQEAA